MSIAEVGMAAAAIIGVGVCGVLEFVKEAMRLHKEHHERRPAPPPRPPVLKDDAMWANQWRDSPLAFWLCPDLWVPNTSKIDWSAVEQRPSTARIEGGPSVRASGTVGEAGQVRYGLHSGIVSQWVETIGGSVFRMETIRDGQRIAVNLTPAQAEYLQKGDVDRYFGLTEAEE